MINELKQVGLNEYEARVYTTLLEHGSLKGGDVCKKSNVPHGKTYESLVSLENKGFISITPLRPKIFTALNPKIAIGHLISEKIKTFEQIQFQLSEKLSARKKVKPDDMSEKIQIFAGAKKAWPLSLYLFNNSKKVMRHMFTYEVRNYEQDRALIEAVKRGVEVRRIAAKKTPQGLKWMKEDLKRGLKVRYFPVEEIRLEIKDNDQSMLYFLNPKDSRDRIILFFNHGLFSKMLANFFDEIWEKAEIIK